MKNPGHHSQDPLMCIRLASKDCQSALEVGCMFGDKLAATGCEQKVGIEPFAPYLAKAMQDNPDTIFLRSEASIILNCLLLQSIDVTLFVDVLEHAWKNTAINWLHKAKKITRKRIIVFAPCGNHPQTTDATGMGGGYWQTHRSTWEPEDLKKLGFDVAVWPEFHRNEKDKDPRAMFATWEPER